MTEYAHVFSYMHKIEDQSQACVIKMYCLKPDGGTAIVTMREFKPFFYIEPPKEYTVFGNKKTKLSPLSLKNLTGAFLVLLIGPSLSLWTFVCEKIISIRKQHGSRTRRKLKKCPNNLIEVTSKTTEIT